MSKVAILGYGVVGSGVYEIIKGGVTCGTTPVEVKYILDIRDFEDHPEKHLFVKDFGVILADEEVDIVAEVIGGATVAYQFTKAALLAGKNVVTSNKELVATHGTELLAIAKEKGVSYLFEASVGGGIPLIHPMAKCLAANKITRIMGILNGTTNYILTSMVKDGKSFEDALSSAQKNGYAEADPTADIEGIDACRKIAILSSLVYGNSVKCEDIYTEGITKITLDDVNYAAKFGCSIKLICFSEKTEKGAEIWVSPMLLPNSFPLAGVDDVFNAGMVRGNNVGDVMMYGRGAGKLPTASAVLSDILDIASGEAIKRPISWMGPDIEVTKHEDTVSKYYVRCGKEDLNAAKTLFGDAEFLSAEETVFITQKTVNKELTGKLAQFKSVKSVIKVYSE